MNNLILFSSTIFRLNASSESNGAKVTFSLEGKKNTVDLEIQEKSGNVTNARLIDTMDPI